VARPVREGAVGLLAAYFILQRPPLAEWLVRQRAARHKGGEKTARARLGAGHGLLSGRVPEDMLAFLAEGKVESTTAAQAAGAISPADWRDAAWSGRAGAAG
jgi:hypothetical protein